MQSDVRQDNVVVLKNLGDARGDGPEECDCDVVISDEDIGMRYSGMYIIPNGSYPIRPESTLQAQRESSGVGV